MEHLSNDHEDSPNQQENSHKQFHETGHPAVNIMGHVWKLRQQHDQNFQMGGGAIVEQILASQEKNKSKGAGL